MIEPLQHARFIDSQMRFGHSFSLMLRNGMSQSFTAEYQSPSSLYFTPHYFTASARRFPLSSISPRHRRRRPNGFMPDDRLMECIRLLLK